MRLDDVSFGRYLRVGFELVHLRNYQYEVHEFFYTGADLCRDSRPWHVTAEFIEIDAMFRKRGLRPLDVRVRFIDLVDGYDERDFRLPDARERFQGLRFDSVVCRNNEYGDIGDVGAARTDGCERRMTRRVDEGYLLAFMNYLVGSDVLGDAARLFCDDVRLANEIQEC